MNHQIKLAMLATAVIGVTGCSQEVGSQLDNGWFGDATMHNMLAQTCNLSGGKGGKAGALVDPLVVLDPSSTQSRPIYRVHCDGKLNGKYAQVIFNDYVLSAAPPPEFGIEVDASAQ